MSPTNRSLDFFLGDEEVQLPTGGLFVSTGLIAQWEAAVVFRVYVNPNELDRDKLHENDIQPNVYANGWCYFESAKKGFQNCSAAIEKMDDMGIENARTPWGDLRKPEELWLWHPLSEIITLNDPTAFGDSPRFECPVSTLESNKSRYGLHLTALPAAVAATANFLGYDNPGFDIAELISSDTIWTDEFIEEMTGVRYDSEATGRKQYVDIGWSESVLGKRRDELWAALGEPDVRKYQMTGTLTRKSEPSPFATESTNLSTCLRVVQKSWKKPVWGNLFLAKRAGYDKGCFTKEGTRLSVPALMEIFANEAAARAAAEAESAESGGTSTKKTIPDAYAKYPEMFHEAVKRFKEKGVQGPPPVIAAAVAAEPDFQGCDAAEVMAWL